MYPPQICQPQLSIAQITEMTSFSVSISAEETGTETGTCTFTVQMKPTGTDSNSETYSCSTATYTYTASTGALEVSNITYILDGDTEASTLDTIKLTVSEPSDGYANVVPSSNIVANSVVYYLYSQTMYAMD